ncbi:serine/threonine protein kinase [Streptomyces sp. NBC_01537]|uniref:serine/threonine-protein kinase n=1 Tax=Streptomyces sp. NBC_01537 TaxID=2903896 RepID=UPI003865DDB8
MAEWSGGGTAQSAGPVLQPPVADYESLHQVATGRHSTVFMCNERATGAEVAVKILHVVVQDEARRLAIHSELLSAAVAAKHPCSVAVSDAGFTSDHRPYLAEPFHRGVNAQARMAAFGPYPVDEVVVIGLRLALALHSAHRRGVLHLDVRPANILFDDTGDALLADHGIARILQRCDPGLGAVFDPMYAPRELFGWENPGPAADVYGLGATLYALLNGEAAHSDAGRTSWSALYQEVLRGELPPPRRPDVPEPLLTLVRRMMSADPERRPPLTEVHRVLRLLLPASHAARVPSLEPEPAPQLPLPGWDPADDLTPEEEAAAEEPGERARDESRRRVRRGLVGAGVVAVVFAVAAMTVTLALRGGSAATERPGKDPSPTATETGKEVPAAQLAELMPRNVTATKAEGNVQIAWQVPKQSAGVIGYLVQARPPGADRPIQKSANVSEQAVFISAGSVTDDTCYTVLTVVSMDGAIRFAPSQPLCKTDGP